MIDSEINDLESDFARINIKNTGPSLSTIVSEDLNDAKENIDIDKVLKELKQNPEYDIPADYKLPDEYKPFIPISATPELFEDFIQKVTDMRIKHSNRKFCPPVILSDLQGEGVWNDAVRQEKEEYECYIKDVKDQFSRQSVQEALGSDYFILDDLNDTSKENTEFMKVVKAALLSDSATDKNVLLYQLDDAIKQDNSNDFNLGCTCYDDSDDDSQ